MKPVVSRVMARFPSTDEIKPMREQLGWKQKDLAKKVRVTVSMISKIEAGLKKPSYKVATTIFNELENAIKKVGISSVMPVASDIATRPVYTVSTGQALGIAIAIMMERNVDQVPVVDGEGLPVGGITTRTVVKSMGSPGFRALLAKDVMGPAFPAVEGTWPLPQIEFLLMASPCVIVQVHHKIEGIITWSNFIENPEHVTRGRMNALQSRSSE